MDMNKVLKVSLFFFIVCLASCSGRRNDFREIKDEDLTVQLKSVKGDEDFNYAVRIFLKDSPNIKSEELYNKMWYHTDSCFYMTDGAKKIYPVFQQPVSNGLKDSFEYLIAFDKKMKGGAMKFIFDSKELNKKIYSFNL